MNSARTKATDLDVRYVPEDKFFGAAYIDKDEWTEQPLPHRYIHGGFEGTDTRFSFYFPPKEQYAGRFLHAIEGGTGGSDNTTHVRSLEGVVPMSNLDVAFGNGAYFVESNQGHLGLDLSGVKGDPSIVCWRASAESARFSKMLAAKIYGHAPQHGYCFGGSGGGVRSLKCLEETDVWSGGVPFVMPHASQGTFFSLQANAIRVLGSAKMAAINDAIEVGGDNQAFRGLNTEQAEALSTLYKTGFPRHISPHNAFEQVLVWSWFTWLFEQYDPTYFEDFWSKPGYVGHDEPQRLQASSINVKSKVVRVLTAAELRTFKPQKAVVDEYGIGEDVRLFTTGLLGETDDTPMAIILEDHVATGKMGCADLRITSGAAAGRAVSVLGVLGEAIAGSGIGGKLFTGVKPGDEVVVDNRRYLAWCFHYRHQVEPRFEEWRHSVTNGEPIYPQRKILEKLFSAPYTYRLGNKKIIIVQNLMDRGTWPCGSVSYERNLAANGANMADQFRVWLVEHAQHVPASMLAPGEPPVTTTRLVDYEGYVHQALRALINWVENGKAPLPSSRYTYTADCEVLLDDAGAERGGIQPVVEVRGNGRLGRVNVARGERVELTVATHMPKHAGKIVRVEWDFDGRGQWPQRHTEIDGSSASFAGTVHHVFDKPGTYFASCRVIGHPDGDTRTSLYRLPNVGRIRIVVS